MRLCKRDHNGTTETLEDVTNCGFVRHWSLLLSLTVVLLFVSCGKNVIIDEYSIIPQPVEITMDKGEFTGRCRQRCSRRWPKAIRR